VSLCKKATKMRLLVFSFLHDGQLWKRILHQINASSFWN